MPPSGFNDAFGTGVDNGTQVGYTYNDRLLLARCGAGLHALVWFGTADSVIDLNQYLPAEYSNAVACGSGSGVRECRAIGLG